MMYEAGVYALIANTPDILYKEAGKCGVLTLLPKGRNHILYIREQNQVLPAVLLQPSALQLRGGARVDS